MIFFYHITREVEMSFAINKMFPVFLESFFKISICLSNVKFLTVDACQLVYSLRIIYVKNFLFHYYYYIIQFVVCFE